MQIPLTKTRNATAPSQVSRTAGLNTLFLGRTIPERPLRIGFDLGMSTDTSERPQDVVHTSPAGLITVASTGSGKGTDHIIPNVLTFGPGSLFVVDPKGEIAAVTARHRASIGQVIILDPFSICTANSSSVHGFNPLDLVDADSDTAVDDAMSLANLIITPSFTSDPFWEVSAANWLGATILFVAASCSGADRSIATVRRIWMASDEKLATILAAMKAFKTGRGFVSEVANTIISCPDRTRGSIMSTLHSSIQVFSSRRVEQSLQPSTLRVADILSGQAMTVYMVLPPERLASHSRLLRLWLGSIIMVMARRKAAPPVTSLILADEVGQLGHMPMLLAAASLMRGYGVRLWTLWQSFSQIDAIYGKDAGTLIDNAGTILAYGINSHATAERLAQLTGWSGPLLGMPSDCQVIAMQGRPPFLSRRVSYLGGNRFQGLYDANPFYHLKAPKKEQVESAAA